MKKFSVLLVAILALMMLFSSCENEPKERAATKEDGEIVGGLIMSAMVGDPVEKKTVEIVEMNEDEGTVEVEFKKAEYKDGEGKVVVVLNGTLTGKANEKTLTISVDFGDGTKYKGEDHTLLANVVTSYETGDVVSYKIKLDGVILTGLDLDSIL